MQHLVHFLVSGPQSQKAAGVARAPRELSLLPAQHNKLWPHRRGDQLQRSVAPSNGSGWVAAPPLAATGRLEAGAEAGRCCLLRGRVTSLHSLLKPKGPKSTTTMVHVEFWPWKKEKEERLV